MAGMGSTASAVSSAGVTPLTFTGESQYASDFQNILDRAVSIANIPLEQLENEQSDISSKDQLLTSLNSAVADMGQKVAALGTLASTQGLTATSSDPNTVSVQATGATTPATYAVSDITSVAEAASETSLTGYANVDSTPVSANGTMSLVVGGNTYPIDVSKNNNLTGLADAINAAGAGVTATVITTGTGDNPDYLSISADATGATTLQLIDDPKGTANNILTDTNQGSNAMFNLNGEPVDSPTNTINDVVPGLTFTILATTASADSTDSGETVNLTLATDPSTLSSALSNLVTSYNALATQCNAQTGTSGGLLTGNSIIRQTQQAMRQLTGYEGTGAITNLADLGIELDTNGQMSLNQSTFNALTSSQIDAAFQFLGSATTGLGALASNFTQISDPVSGLIEDQENQYNTTNTRLTNQISTLTDQINTMQTNLLQQLNSADELCQELENQQSELTSSIQALDYTSYGAPLQSS
jgi:flagellar hook-associated protein 2